MTEYRIVEDKPRLAFQVILVIGCVLGGLIVALWPSPAQTPGYRAMCEAQGGLVVRTQDGRLCLWAGAVIPVNAP